MDAKASACRNGSSSRAGLRRWPAAVLAVGMLCVACAGPGGNSAGLQAASTAGMAPPAPGHSAGDYMLEVLPESYLGAEARGTFRLAVEQRGAETVVHVLGASLRNQRALYARLTCPPGVAVSAALVDCGLGPASDVISLCHADAGVVHFGAVLKRFQEREGVSGAAELARLVLRQKAVSVTRAVCSVPARTADHMRLYVNVTEGALEWDYRLSGDYSQDGQVDIGDLTPLAQYWGDHGESAPDSWGLTGVRFPDDDICEVLDTSGNMVIDAADVTALGLNYGAHIEQWNIYASLNPWGDFPPVDLENPQDNGAVPSSIAPLATIGFMDRAVTNPAKVRLRFSMPLVPSLNGMALWVRPVAEGKDGTPSNWSPYDQSLAGKFFVQAEAESRLLDPGLLLQLSTCTFGADKVVARIKAINATSARYLVFKVMFDGDSFHFAGTPGPTLASDQAGGRFWIAGPLTRRGVAKFTSVDTSATYPIPTGDYTAVQALFSRGMQVIHAGVPLNTRVPSQMLAYDALSATLTWYYGKFGDNGQDGDVWLDDFATNDYYMGQQATDPYSAAFIADTDGNGTVELNDITATGVNWNKGLTGYNVYSGSTPLDVESASLIGHVFLDDALGNPLTDRLHFALTVPAPVSGQYLWVTIERTGTEGSTPSEYVQIP